MSTTPRHTVCGALCSLCAVLILTFAANMAWAQTVETEGEPSPHAEARFNAPLELMTSDWPLVGGDLAGSASVSATDFSPPSAV